MNFVNKRESLRLSIETLSMKNAKSKQKNDFVSYNALNKGNNYFNKQIVITRLY